MRIIDHRLRDGLRDNSLHHLLDRALFREAVLRVGVVCLDFIAQVPVTEQAHLWREQALPPVIDQVIHPDVVAGNVVGGIGACLCDGQVHIGGDALGEALSQASLGPLPARPFRAEIDALFERGERKIQEHHKGELVLKEVVDHVRGRIVSAEKFVVRANRAEIQILLGCELAGNLVHVAVELFEQALVALEHRMNGLLVAGEVCAHESLEDGRIAIFRTPEFHHLVKAGADAGLLALAMFGEQLGLQFHHGVVHLRGSQGFGGRLRRGVYRCLSH